MNEWIWGRGNGNEIDEKKTKEIVKWIKVEWINEEKWNWWEIMWKLKWKREKTRKKLEKMKGRKINVMKEKTDIVGTGNWDNYY